MTRDELGKELKLLLAFAKIVVLDRAIAEKVMGDWLKNLVAEQPLHAMTRRDLYISLGSELPIAAMRVAGRRGDSLGELRRLSGFMRAYLFLTSAAGFAVEYAEDICDQVHAAIRRGAAATSQRAIAAPAANLTAAR